MNSAKPPYVNSMDDNHALIDAMAQPAAVLGADGRVMAVNSAWRSLAEDGELRRVENRAGLGDDGRPVHGVGGVNIGGMGAGGVAVAGEDSPELLGLGFREGRAGGGERGLQGLDVGGGVEREALEVTISPGAIGPEQMPHGPATGRRMPGWRTVARPSTCSGMGLCCCGWAIKRRPSTV